MARDRRGRRSCRRGARARPARRSPRRRARGRAETLDEPLHAGRRRRAQRAVEGLEARRPRVTGAQIRCDLVAQRRHVPLRALDPRQKNLAERVRHHARGRLHLARRPRRERAFQKRDGRGQVRDADAPLEGARHAPREARLDAVQARAHVVARQERRRRHAVVREARGEVGAPRGAPRAARCRGDRAARRGPRGPPGVRGRVRQTARGQVANRIGDEPGSVMRELPHERVPRSRHRATPQEARGCLCRPRARRPVHTSCRQDARSVTSLPAKRAAAATGPRRARPRRCGRARA